MTILTTHKGGHVSPQPGKRGVIHIMCDAFPPEELSGLIDCLNENGYDCVTFEGLKGVRAAMSDHSASVLVVKADDVNVAPLIEVLRAIR